MDEGKLSLESKDIAAEKRQELLRLFPETQTEGGKIDFDQLKRALGESVDAGRERYGMSWPGKADCFRLIQSPSTATLLPVREQSVRFDETENMIIEGDNLEVLKLLQKGYQGSIKTIYIDPPYNTGNDFIYPDDFADNLKNYLQYTGQADAEDKRFSNNSETDGRYHSKWLDMMYPRLYLARNLLRSDGIICVSIDNKELTNLRILMNQLFGETCFLGAVVRTTGQTTGQDSGGLGSSFDYVLVYARDADTEIAGLPLSDEDVARFQDSDARGQFHYWQLRKTGSADRREDRPDMYFAVESPDAEPVFPIGPGGYDSRWRCEKSTYKQWCDEDLILWKKTEDWRGILRWWPYVKYYLEGRTKRPSPLWDDLEGSKKATKDLRDLMGEKVFDNPKPLGLISRLCEISGLGKDGTILDFFAGSGSTAHAVLAANEKDGGSRKFILVQLPEPTRTVKEDGTYTETQAWKSGYKTIADLTKERVRRAIKAQIDKRNPEQGTLAIGQPSNEQGFRVFKLAPSNFKVWDAHTDEGVLGIERQMELAVNHIMPDRSAEDLFYEILIKSEYPLTAKVESFDAAGIAAFSVEDDALIVCVERKVTAEAVAVIAKRSPSKVIFLDEAFSGNDQLKANAKMNFESAGVKRFETV